MVNRLPLSGMMVPLGGRPASVNGRTVSPNGLADGVFEGGGMKGIGHVGALSYAEEIGLRFVNVAGTSAGAIIASLVAANYTAREIVQIMDEIHFQDFKDEGKLDYIPLVGKVAHLFLDKGIYEGDFFEQTMERYLARQGVQTFEQLVIPEEQQESRYRYRLRVIASDISRGKMLVLPQDIQDYGMRPDDLSVARAIRMSMSIPFVFEPVVMEYTSVRGRSEKAYVVDGGVLSNYPVHLFDERGVPSWPTFGFKLQEAANPKPATIRGPISLGLAIYSTMFSAMDRQYIEEKNWDRTIAIPTLGVGTTDFDLGEKKRQALFNSGYRAAKKFFEEWWDWSKHIEARRKRLTMEQV